MHYIPLFQFYRLSLKYLTMAAERNGKVVDQHIWGRKGFSPAIVQIGKDLWVFYPSFVLSGMVQLLWSFDHILLCRFYIGDTLVSLSFWDRF